MKIVRKERIDVKKYMEDMKANKTATKRTFASVQQRTTHPNERLSRDRLMNQYDNYSNNSMPQFSRPSYRNQSFLQSNSRPNPYNQFDIMSQTSHNYRQNYVSPPTMIVPQVNPNLYYNQIPPFYGSSQFPPTQFMYPNVNNSNQITNYEYPQMNQVISQMNTQSFEVIDKQDRQNVNSKPQLVNQYMSNREVNKLRNTNSLQVITVRKQAPKEINLVQLDAKKDEDNRMIIQSKKEEPINEIFLQKQKKQKQVELCKQQNTIKQEQKVVKKKRAYRRKPVKQKLEVQQPPQKTNEVTDYNLITEDVNNQFEEMLERQRKAETEKYEKEDICKNILTLLDNKLSQNYANISWREVSQQLQRKTNFIKKIDLSGKKSMKKHFSDTLVWLQRLQTSLGIK